MNNNFAQTLDDLHRSQGDLYGELDNALAEVAQACRETGKKGSITLTLSIDPSGRQANIEPKIKTKVPRRTRPASIFYTTEDGRLSRNDPHQTELELREAQQEQALREASDPKQSLRSVKGTGTD